MDITIAGSDVVSDENREERTAGHLWGVRRITAAGHLSEVRGMKRHRRSPGIGNEPPPTISRGVRSVKRHQPTLGSEEREAPPTVYLD